jgi:homoserine O-acetyltransferase/O-succinyltransferase
MRINQWITSASFLALSLMASVPALAQQTTGAPGSPDAMTSPASSAASRFFEVRGFTFQDGRTIPTLRLHYQTLGTPRRGPDGEIDNAVLLLHGTAQDGNQFLAPSFAGPLFGVGEPLDAAKYFIIIPDAIGHGCSSKPSDGLRMAFPRYDYADMVALQNRLVSDGLGVHRLRLILGTSMGCMHTYLWGETYPGEARAIMTMACSPFPVAGENWLWRKGVIDAITTDPSWRHGNYRRQPVTAMRAIAVLTAIATSGAPNLAARYPTQSDVEAMLWGKGGGRREVNRRQRHPLSVFRIHRIRRVAET